MTGFVARYDLSGLRDSDICDTAVDKINGALSLCVLLAEAPDSRVVRSDITLPMCTKNRVAFSPYLIPIYISKWFLTRGSYEVYSCI